MQLGLWIAIIGAFVNAAGWVAVRSLSQKESTATIIFYFTLFSALGALVLGAHSFVAPNAQQALWLVVVGAAGIVGQYFLTIAYRHADAAVVTPLGYTEVFAMLALAWFFFDEIPDALSWAGIALITLAGILVSRPEKA
jgi:drug/metabolite transporter (DMT)-like permease